MRAPLVFAAVVSASALAASGAAAAVYSVQGDFGSSNFSYGMGEGGLTFTPFTQHNACAPNLDCYNNGPGGLPQVLKNNGADYFGGTVVIPAGAVHFHPGPAASGEDAIIRFIASAAGTYNIGGAFARQDVTGNGNGTQASVFANVGLSSTSLFSTTIAASSYGSSTAFSGLTATLGVGDSIDFVLNNRGEYTYDSTGVSATLSTAAPEPATWAMMLLGFGGMGAVLRSRRRVAVA